MSRPTWKRRPISARRFVAASTSWRTFQASDHPLSERPFYPNFDAYRLTAADAREAAQRRVTVVTTVSDLLEATERGLRGFTPSDSEAFRALIRGNLSVLKAAGVSIAFGSDSYQATSEAEARTIGALGLFSPLEVLRVWSMVTPTMIFPTRKIAHLEPCYEASFLVLDGDPTRFGYRQKSATWDEPIHLAAGSAALAKGDYRFESTHPPFMRMWAALPLLFMGDVHLDTAVIDRTPPREWHSGCTAFTHATKVLYIHNDANRLLNAARFMIVLCGIGLGVLVFAWTYEWLGLVPAACATAFYTISPNVLANTSLVTTDAGISCFIFGTVYFFWRTTQRYSAANVAGLIAFFMLAIVTKFSALILGPLIVVLLAVAASAGTCITPRRIAALVPALAVAAVLAIWAIYGFQYAPSGSAAWVLSLETAPLAQTVPALARLTEWI